MSLENVPNCPMHIAVTNIESSGHCNGVPGYEICLLCQYIGEPQGKFAPINVIITENFGRRMSSTKTIDNWRERKKTLLGI
ncbi:MAG: hypothetical protein WC784_01330 [Candidatus Shapirobacteria bacterium]|jgi:hypothetical protein